LKKLDTSKNFEETISEKVKLEDFKNELDKIFIILRNLFFNSTEEYKNIEIKPEFKEFYDHIERKVESDDYIASILSYSHFHSSYVVILDEDEPSLDIVLCNSMYKIIELMQKNIKSFQDINQFLKEYKDAYTKIEIDNISDVHKPKRNNIPLFESSNPEKILNTKKNTTKKEDFKFITQQIKLVIELISIRLDILIKEGLIRIDKFFYDKLEEKIKEFTKVEEKNELKNYLIFIYDLLVIMQKIFYNASSFHPTIIKNKKPETIDRVKKMTLIDELRTFKEKYEELKIKIKLDAKLYNKLYMLNKKNNENSDQLNIKYNEKLKKKRKRKNKFR
jgi:hypothetical protein